MSKPARETVLVLGSSGFLGSSLCPRLEADGYDVIRQVRGESDGGSSEVVELSDPQALAKLLVRSTPRVVINLAALTNVDLCERDVAQAFESNAGIVANIVRALEISRSPAHLIQISTDQVYDGEGPHLETKAHPINVYALTKYTGELQAAQAKATILRTNFVGPSAVSRARGLADWVYGTLRRGQSVVGFDDVSFSPLDIDGLCLNISRVIAQPMPGLFNLGSNGGCSKGHFCRELARLCGLDESLVLPGSASSAGLAARRPNDMRMTVTKFEAAFGVQLPSTDSVIEAISKRYAELI